LDWEPRNVRQYNQINCGFWYESLLKLVGASNDYTDCSGVVVSRLGYWYPFGHSALRVSPRYQEDMHVSRPTAFDVSFDATIEYDKPSAILTAFGLVVFVMAPLITKSNKAYMTTTTLLGMALGLAILLVMVVMLMSRMFPQRGKLAALATGVGFGGVLITKTSARLVGLLADNVVFVGIYAIVSGCIAFGVAYRTAFFQHEQTKQLLQWMIQLSAVLVIVLNSCNFFVLLGMIGTLLGRSTLASLLYYTSKYWTFVVFMPYYVVVEGRRAWQRKKGGRKANVGGYGSGSGGGEEEEDASGLRSMLREDAVPVAAMLGGSVGAVFSSERAFTSPNGNKYTPKMRRSTRRKFLESKNVDVNKFDVLGAAEYVTEAEYEQSMSDTTKQELAKLMQRVAQGGEFVHLLSPIAKKRVGEALSYYEDEQNMDEDL
jgi:MFS family permease